MSDLKDFLDKEQLFRNKCNVCGDDYIFKSKEYYKRTDLGMFFWERGGKQFVKDYWNTEIEIRANGIIEQAKEIVNLDTEDFMTSDFELSIFNHTQDFLDALACLGEEKVKELIEKERGVSKK